MSKSKESREVVMELPENYTRRTVRVVCGNKEISQEEIANELMRIITKGDPVGYAKRVMESEKV